MGRCWPRFSSPIRGDFTHDEDSRSQARTGPLLVKSLCQIPGPCGCHDADAVGRTRPARRSAIADRSGHGAGSDTHLRRADDRSPRRPRWRRWRWRPWRWRRPRWWRISRWRRWLPWRRFPRRWRHVPWRRISLRSCFPRWRLPPWRVRVSAPSLSPALLRVLLRLPVLFLVPSLPGDPDLPRPAQDLPLSPLASPSLLAPPSPASSLLLMNSRRVETNQAPGGRLICVGEENLLAINPNS